MDLGIQGKIDFTGDFPSSPPSMMTPDDVTMSVDNTPAVGGASHGELFLLLFGPGLYIPIILFASGLLHVLMDK